jgi:PTS system cellobiose-specific IIB component
MNLLLVCSAGMSTSILVKRMEEAATAQSVEATIDAVSEADLKGKLEQAQVILIGPQVRYLKGQIEKQAQPYGIPVAVIDSVAYGTMDGAKVLAQAQALLEE